MRPRFHAAATKPTPPADVQHPPCGGMDVSAHVARLNRAAKREPTAVLGVLQYWLAPTAAIRPHEFSRR